MERETNLIEVLVDFNSAAGGDLVKASKRFITKAWVDLAPGVWVRMIDADGNRCYGVVEAPANGNAFVVKAQWETWAVGPPHVKFNLPFQPEVDAALEPALSLTA